MRILSALTMINEITTVSRWAVIGGFFSFLPASSCGHFQSAKAANGSDSSASIPGTTGVRWESRVWETEVLFIAPVAGRIT